MRALMFRSKKNALLSIGVGGLFLVGLSLHAAAPKTSKHHAIAVKHTTGDATRDHVPATDAAPAPALTKEAEAARLGDADAGNDAIPSVLAGLSLPPLKSLKVPASAEMVERLHLKDGVRVLAANLSGL